MLIILYEVRKSGVKRVKPGWKSPSHKLHGKTKLSSVPGALTKVRTLHKSLFRLFLIKQQYLKTVGFILPAEKRLEILSQHALGTYEKEQDGVSHGRKT